jgi:hypothetical protein
LPVQQLWLQHSLPGMHGSGLNRKHEGSAQLSRKQIFKYNLTVTQNVFPSLQVIDLGQLIR